MRNMRYMAAATGILMMAGCTPGWDLQGHNPREYYAKHPISNKVETRYLSYLLHLESQADGVQPQEAANLKQLLAPISPLAVESTEIQVSPGQLDNEARNAYLRSALIRMGLPAKTLHFVPAEEVRPADVNIQVAYAAVVSPRCPDWRMSPVTSYSNMTYSPNISCATVTNLGLMVADPRDLVQGEGTGAPDTQNTTAAIQQYHGDGTSSSGSSSGSSGTSTETATTGQ